MKKSSKFLIAMIIMLISGCSDKHLITDKEYLKLVENSFNGRKTLAACRESELFSVFNHDLSTREKEALKFLYAFMPLSDLADYDGDFFLANIDMALHAKTGLPWGKDIPEEIFLHYVLPCRINNENLDSFRIVYYDEIMQRVKGKDLPDAALEINHWCHEKVSYQPADSRTSAPMSTILSARGRCGEESTFTVAALRTAGIPARQVYTPRWAHSDDNHAWVEIWFKGTWYYMGACEPEPVLDRGWFTEPARRAMLVHTKSFGAYTGNENPVNIHKNYTEVNNLSKYAVTKKIFVKVVDSTGLPVDNARVEYQLYNYAEFYPIAVVPTDAKGISQFETGLGDLLIWAHDKDNFDYKKISVSETDTLILKIGIISGSNCNLDVDLDLDVPVARSALPIPPPEMAERNLKRTNEENSIRGKYIDSWIKPEEVKKISVKLNIDTTRLMNVFTRSMGNYNEISSFLSVVPDSLIDLAVSMLEILADKDLRDIKGVILSDHLLNCIKTCSPTDVADYEIFLDYILNPRIANEMVVAWRGYFRKVLPAELMRMSSADPSLIVQYLDNNIKIADDENYYKTPLTPRGVNELKVSDSYSRAICFVAICRSIGIPSRLEPGSKVPQYLLNSTWNDVFFSEQKQPTMKKGYVKFISSEIKPVPEYYIHFTLAKLENGRYNTLEYDYNKKISDFKEELPLAPGSYMLVTGNRLSNSKILSNLNFFDLSEDEHKTVEVKLRNDISVNKISGRIDLERILSLFGATGINSERILEHGVVIVWIEPDKEPTKHIFNDLPHLKQELDSWGGYFLFLSDPSQNWQGLNNEELRRLPSNILFGNDRQILNNILRSGESSASGLPYVIMADKNGNILYSSAGYRIGIVEQILRRTE